jgi:hypothetical protein
MKSSDLSGFSSWQRWCSATVGNAPDLPGVYALRLVGKVFGRFKGESDIVYIGRTQSAHGTIKRRLRNHLPSRADSSDLAARLRDCEGVGGLEVAWKPLKSSDEAMVEEARLLRHYCSDHFELPPANRVQPARYVRKAIEHLSQSPALSRDVAERAVESILEDYSGKRGGQAATE